MWRFNHSTIRKFASKSPRKSLRSQLSPFIKFARPEFKIVGYSLGLLLISSSVTMSVPFSMGAIIDIVMGHKGVEVEEQKSVLPKGNSFVKKILVQTGSLTGLFGLLGCIFIIGGAANAGRQVLMTKASERVITRLRTTLFSKADIIFMFVCVLNFNFFFVMF